MFYSTQILAKKGPLGLVWIAAHLDGRLKRQQINSASIDESVETLLHPEAPLALRLSGQLLLGVVRIYQRKVRGVGKAWNLSFRVGLQWQSLRGFSWAICSNTSTLLCPPKSHPMNPEHNDTLTIPMQRDTTYTKHPPTPHTHTCAQPSIHAGELPPQGL